MRGLKPAAVFCQFVLSGDAALSSAASLATTSTAVTCWTQSKGYWTLAPMLAMLAASDGNTGHGRWLFFTNAVSVGLVFSRRIKLLFGKGLSPISSDVPSSFENASRRPSVVSRRKLIVQDKGSIG
jgi:hypothetical protein